MDTIEVTVKDPGQVPAIVERILGFVPRESLIVLGIGGGPVARVDLGDVDALMAGLAPARGHWVQVVLVLYSDDPEVVLEYEAAWVREFPGIEVLGVVRVHDDTVYRDGVAHPRTVVNLGPLAARAVAPSRDEMAASITGDVRTTEEALTMALEAYRVGDGAKAWVCLERFEDLGGPPENVIYRGLSALLTNAVDPKEIPC